MSRKINNQYKIATLIPVLGLSLLMSSTPVLASTERPESPPREAPDPLGQFLEHEYIKNKLSVFAETQYYSWEDKNDSRIKGDQIVAPLTLTYRHNGFDFGLRRAYINSENKTPGTEGKVVTWSDTAVTTAYTFKDSEWPVRISLDYNIPNGKATLNNQENNAIMDSFLVQQTQFGEGENITPGVNITHALSDKDIFGIGISYSKKGSYDPNSETDNDLINPGNERIATLQWQHNERDWMVIGGLIATDFGTTKRNFAPYYKKGNKYDINVTGLWALPWESTIGQRVQINLRYAIQKPNKNIDLLSQSMRKEEENINGDTLYASLDWSKNWHNSHTFHIFSDYLKVKENDYEMPDASYDAGKRKHSLGFGYQYSFNNQSTFLIRAKQSQILDRPESNSDSKKRFKSRNISINFNHKF